LLITANEKLIKCWVKLQYALKNIFMRGDDGKRLPRWRRHWQGKRAIL
jgi:hypothetical protein